MCNDSFVKVYMIVNMFEIPLKRKVWIEFYPKCVKSTFIDGG